MEKVSALEKNWRENNIIAMISEFKSFGEILILPGIENYIKNMLKDGGSLFMIQKGCCGVEVFDPTFVKNSDMLTLQECVAILQYLELLNLNAKYLQGMKDDLTEFKIAAMSEEMDMMFVDRADY